LLELSIIFKNKNKRGQLEMSNATLTRKLEKRKLKIKIFRCGLHSLLEEKINQFLETIPYDRIINIKYLQTNDDYLIGVIEFIK